MDNEVYIVSACRTAIGSFQGALAPLSAPRLGALTIAEAVRRAGVDPKSVDEVIMGQVVQAGAGQAPARQAALGAGLPDSVPCLTINKVCGSSLKAVMVAAAALKAGDAEIVAAGGMESMSNAPYALPGARSGFRLGHGKLVDLMIHDGLWDSFNDFHMGSAAEYTASKSGISRERQDQYAVDSHRKAVLAQEAGNFKLEIVPVPVPQRKGDPQACDRDEGPRRDATLESLARLRPAFQKDGSVTAGNAPGLNDGAACTLVASGRAVAKHQLKPLARITGYATSGVLPRDVFYAPIFAVRNLLEKLKVGIEHFDLIEANEAFSVQALADGDELGWDWDKVNVHGGAVALGHPIGASGARILTTLLYALALRGQSKGLATLCLGGGNAVALAVEVCGS
jgi:acetyl-CoA C-acetyltransferase